MTDTLIIPLIPLRQSVLFPASIMPISVGRSKSVSAVKSIEDSGQPLGIISQKVGSIDEPSRDDLHTIGVTARVLKALKAGDEGYHIVLQGLRRFRILEIIATEPFVRARVEELEETVSNPVKMQALVMNVKRTAREVVELLPQVPQGASQMVDAIVEPSQLADVIAANMDISVEEKMRVLEKLDVVERLELVHELLHQRLEVLKLSNKIDSQVKGEMSKSQREYYLRQQEKAIKEELGELDSAESDVEALEERLKLAALPAEVEKIAQKELKRLKSMAQASAEYSVARTYLEWLADLPWDKTTVDKLDIKNVRELLEQRHYGLEKVKKRIVEFLAVRKLKEGMRGPILCLVGPPGVGKTSLAQSVAEALGRKMHRISLGGVRDEAEIRGHRRTYVGALPGRIVQGLKKAGANNPVMILDEVDKLSSDFRGDPSSALLEVLDPEQNNTFSDHYLEVAFDLSKVLFIATANQLDPVPPALRDRMEIIEIPGYTHDEKRHIAKEHLYKKVLEAHGITDEQLKISDEALDEIIVSYTREAGVRNLERTLANVVRGVAVKIAEGKTEPTVVNKGDLDEYLGPEKFVNDIAERMEHPGVATGLAWTPSGGDILFIEATQMNGKGMLTLTGQLGDVMKESAQAALSYVRARAAEFGLQDRFAKTDIHVHVPAGAIPKDGPSAGVAMVTALTSAMSGIKVRSDVAMTGEITLRGNVLPIGGVKEKVLAATRAGITTVLLPERNRKDIVEVPEEVRKTLTIHFVSRIDEVLDLALERPPERFPPQLSATPAQHPRA